MLIAEQKNAFISICVFWKPKISRTVSSFLSIRSLYRKKNELSKISGIEMLIEAVNRLNGK